LPEKSQTYDSQSAKGADMKARGKREARRQSRKHMIRSAKGAGYESQGKREARRPWSAGAHKIEA